MFTVRAGGRGPRDLKDRQKGGAEKGFKRQTAEGTLYRARSCLEESQ